MACMRTARDLYKMQFLVYSQTPASEAPFKIDSEEGITINNHACLQQEQEVQNLIDFAPDAVYVSGWNNKQYLTISQIFRTRGIPVICGMDNHWQGSSRQKFASFFASFYLKKYFDLIWVPGTWQYSYALKLGFKKNQIITGLYSADVKTFTRLVPILRKRFLFVGRLVHHKAIDLLADAFKAFNEEDDTWELLIVGNGNEAYINQIKSAPNIIHVPFMEAGKLATLISEGGVFVLPSRYEAWGVVIHEAVAGGMPVIASTECGATASFVKNFYNGFIVKPDTSSILTALKQMANLNDEQRLIMSQRSRELALSITPEFWSSQLYSVLHLHKKLSD